MSRFKVERYFRADKHPLGDGLYISIGAEFPTKEAADAFKSQQYLDWDDDIVIEEVSKEEYDRETNDDEVDDEVDAVDDEVDDERYQFCCDCEHMECILGDCACCHPSGLGRLIDDSCIETCDYFECMYCNSSPCVCRFENN